MLIDYYTIAGVCSCGARFYSEVLPNNCAVISLLDKYAAVINYFGGGELCVYHTTNNMCEKTFSKKI